MGTPKHISFHTFILRLQILLFLFMLLLTHVLSSRQSQSQDLAELDSAHISDHFATLHNVHIENEHDSPTYNIKRERDVVEKAPRLDGRDTHRNVSVRGLSWEMFGLIMLVIYSINLWRGIKKNRQVAEAIYALLKASLEANFYAVGVSDSDDDAQLNMYGGTTGDMMKESHSQYRIVASGRKRCSMLIATIDTEKRHDFLSYIMHFLGLLKNQDTLSIQIAIDEPIEPFVFAIVKTRAVKKMRALFKDLDSLSKQHLSTSLSGEFSLLTDAAEVERHIIDIKTSQIISKSGAFLDYLVISDQSELSFSNLKTSIKFSSKIPRNLEGLENLRIIVQYILSLIDRLPQVRLSSALRERNLQLRRTLSRLTAKVARLEHMKKRNDEDSQMRELEGDDSAIAAAEIKRISKKGSNRARAR